MARKYRDSKKKQFAKRPCVKAALKLELSCVTKDSLFGVLPSSLPLSPFPILPHVQDEEQVE